MAPKQLEILIAALSDEKFIEALKGVLEPMIKLAVDSSVESLRQDLKQRDGQIGVLAKENKELKAKLQTQADYLNQLETYTKQENLIIHGIPLASYAESAQIGDTDASNTTLRHENSATTETLVLSLFNTQLGIDLSPRDVSVCHRLKKSQNMQHPPIVIRFTHRKARDAMLNARKKLRDLPNNRVFVNEHLTKANSKIFAQARKLVKDHKLLRAWTSHGHIVIKALNNTVINIKSLSELDQF